MISCCWGGGVGTLWVRGPCRGFRKEVSQDASCNAVTVTYGLQDRFSAFVCTLLLEGACRAFCNGCIFSGIGMFFCGIEVA